MSSKGTKEQTLKESRLARAKALASIDPRRDPPPPGAVMADHAELAHNNTYDLLPKFYVDRAVSSVDSAGPRRCGRRNARSGGTKSPRPTSAPSPCSAVPVVK